MGLWAAALWMGILGYGVLYAGVNKLMGNTCGLRQAFTVQGCTSGGGSGSATPAATGGPTVQRRRRYHDMQMAWLSGQQIP